jgi:hypothetical protein
MTTGGGGYDMIWRYHTVSYDGLRYDMTTDYYYCSATRTVARMIYDIDLLYEYFVNSPTVCSTV